MSRVEQGAAYCQSFTHERASSQAAQPGWLARLIQAYGRCHDRPSTCSRRRPNHLVSGYTLAALDAGIPEQLGLKKQIAVVKGCRTVQKSDLIHNDYTPDIEVDPQTYQVKADGQ